MVIYVDIDNTIFETKGTDYKKSVPILERIKKINKLYDDGHTIIYWTARGTMSGVDWIDLTKEQFKKYNVKYHELKFGKPVYDLFIDDKNIHSDDYFKNN
jgi:CMP-N,N'-diacetyllegionaminic acid synthase